MSRNKSNAKNECNRQLNFDDYNVDSKELAKKLLGKYLVRKIGDSIVKGRIVETECYLGGKDKGSCSFNGRKTERNEPVFMKPGTCFVYSTYGMYHCFNISCKGDGASVHLRALEPVEGIDIIKKNRSHFKKGCKKDLNDYELCNGPAKFCIGFGIDKKCNKQDITTWDEMWIEDSDDISENSIIRASRIGIDKVGKEWSSAPLRFYEYDNPFVSKRDVKAEEIKFPKSDDKLKKVGVKRKMSDA